MYTYVYCKSPENRAAASFISTGINSIMKWKVVYFFNQIKSNQIKQSSYIIIFFIFCNMCKRSTLFFNFIFLKKEYYLATHPCKDSEMSRTLKAERPRFGLTWQQNLIYTFSCGSIVSCHVCTTRAVRLCGLALLRSLYRDIGLHAPPQRAGDILPRAKHKRHFFKGGGGIRFFFFL